MTFADFVFEGQEIMPDDTLVALLVRAAHLSEEKGHKKEDFRFPATDSKLQDIFYALSQTPEGTEVLREFVFSHKRLRPYSPLLTEVVSRLQLSGLIGRENPDFRVAFLRKGSSEYAAQITNLDRTKIDALAQAFLERCAEYL